MKIIKYESIFLFKVDDILNLKKEILKKINLYFYKNNYYIEIEVEFHLHEWSLFAKSNLFNTYGVSAYDRTPAGDERIQRTDKEAKKELVNLVEADTVSYDSWVSEENQYIYDGVT